jgi:hypothetical protein
MEFNVRAGTKVAEFLQSTGIVNILEGPIGSGKTDALCIKTAAIAQQLPPSPIDGLRHTRFALIRNTTPDLKRSTIKSWLECYPQDVYGPLKSGAPMHHNFKYDWPGGAVDMEVDFIGLDKDEDIRKLRSTQYTRILFDELEFIIKDLFDEARTRLRYPAERHGGPKYPGVDAATNAPPEDHWLPIMTGRVEFPRGLSEDDIRALTWPKEWKHFLQPPALIEVLDHNGVVVEYKVNPAAENLHNLPKNYYQNMLPGMRRDAIDSRLMVRTVLVVDGSPVWPMFRRETHVAGEVLHPVPRHDVYIGLDFGRSPAAVFLQRVNNRVQVQFELIGQNEGATTFAPKVKQLLVEKYPDHAYRAFGDPKGADKGQNDERTAYDIFNANGIKVEPPPGLKNNSLAMRVDTVAHSLNQMYDGGPVVRISPLCRTLIVGCAGRYHNERDEKGELSPSKDRYSHVADAWQYAMIGMGEGRRMIGLKPTNELVGMKVWNRGKTMRRITA